MGLDMPTPGAVLLPGATVFQSTGGTAVQGCRLATRVEYVVFGGRREHVRRSSSLESWTLWRAPVLPRCRLPVCHDMKCGCVLRGPGWVLLPTRPPSPLPRGPMASADSPTLASTGESAAPDSSLQTPYTDCSLLNVCRPSTNVRRLCCRLRNVNRHVLQCSQHGGSPSPQSAESKRHPPRTTHLALVGHHLISHNEHVTFPSLGRTVCDDTAEDHHELASDTAVAQRLTSSVHVPPVKEGTL